MKKLNFFRITLIVVALIILVHYLFFTKYFPSSVNTTIEIVLSLVEIVLIYGYVKAIRKK
ncbi:hypothetical protein ACYATM_00270 [Lactobacillaceae bacterium Scapto_B20]